MFPIKTDSFCERSHSVLKKDWTKEVIASAFESYADDFHTYIKKISYERNKIRL